MALSEDTIVDWTQQVVYAAMQVANPWYWVAWAGVFLIAGLISMAPWTLPKAHGGLDLIGHAIRRCNFWTGVCLAILLAVFIEFYDLSYRGLVPQHWNKLMHWLRGSFISYGWMPILAFIAGYSIRFLYFRYIHVTISALLRKLRNVQEDESESDIRNERIRFNAKDFQPAKYYAKDGSFIFVGLDEDDKPLTIPIDTWRETNMQIIGPTRYGKGVVAGDIMDQVVHLGDALFYIDPKKDRWAPHVLLQACQAAGRPFYYLALHDNAVGYWSPFTGGNRRDAYTRLTSIFEMQEGGDAGTDFYKAQEKKLFNRIITSDQSLRIQDIYLRIKSWNDRSKDDKDKALKMEAQLENWRQIGALNPPEEIETFSIEKALLEGGVVYVQGELMDETVKKATKAFIMELVQESMRLASKREHHVTIVIDEVRFLVSKMLADALATAVGSRVNIVTMYQSILDLRTPDDVNLDGEAILQSVNVNSQLKLIYGGADAETAEWVSKMSGTRTKKVTSMEKTTIRTAGAEEWDKGRTLKTLEEALIPENVMLTLPPRVCVLFRPRELAAVSHSAHVPVKSEKALQDYLAERADIEKAARARAKEKEMEKAAALGWSSADDAAKEDVSCDEEIGFTAYVPPMVESGPAVPKGATKYELTELVAEGIENLDDEKLKYIYKSVPRKDKVRQLVDAKTFKAGEKLFREIKEKEKAAKSQDGVQDDLLHGGSDDLEPA